MKIQAAIFDLDGTLLYTLDSISLSCNKVMKAHQLPPVSHEQLKQFVGNAVMDLLVQSFAAGGSHETVDESTVAEFRACFKEDCDYHVHAYDGINDLLAYMKAHHIRIACNTNKPHENACKLIQKHFPNVVEAVQGNADDLPKKPHPAGALRLCEQMGVCAQNVLYIGDSDVDMLTAHAAHMYAIGAAWGYRGEDELRAAGAHFVASTPQNILDFLKMQVN